MYTRLIHVRDAEVPGVVSTDLGVVAPVEPQGVDVGQQSLLLGRIEGGGEEDRVVSKGDVDGPSERDAVHFGEDGPGPPELALVDGALASFPSTRTFALRAVKNLWGGSLPLIWRTPLLEGTIYEIFVNSIDITGGVGDTPPTNTEGRWMNTQSSNAASPTCSATSAVPYRVMSSVWRIATVAVVLLVAVASSSFVVIGASQAGASDLLNGTLENVTVPGNLAWTDSGYVVPAGLSVTFSASGTVSGMGDSGGPNGSPVPGCISGLGDDADHGNSPLSIIESPQVIARVG